MKVTGYISAYYVIVYLHYYVVSNNFHYIISLHLLII